MNLSVNLELLHQEMKAGKEEQQEGNTCSDDWETTNKLLGREGR